MKIKAFTAMKYQLTGACLAFAMAQMPVAFAATPIQFNPNGTGAAGALTVGTLDWVVGNAVALGGTPAAGLSVGSKIVALSQSRLMMIQDPDSYPLPMPAGTATAVTSPSQGPSGPASRQAGSANTASSANRVSEAAHGVDGVFIGAVCQPAGQFPQSERGGGTAACDGRSQGGRVRPLLRRYRA